MDILISLVQIIIIDLVLSGDNAIVIAMASRKLPLEQRKKAILWGTGGAIGLRIILTVAAVLLLKIPYLMVVGGLLLAWISLKLLIGQEDEKEISAGNSFWEAVRIIIIADFVMSLDNVLAVAGAAHGNIPLLVIGILLSIPIMVFGSTLILRMIERYPAIIYIGAAILAWTAGGMIVGDKHLGPYLQVIPGSQYILPLIITIVVLGIGYLLQKRQANKQESVSNTP